MRLFTTISTSLPKTLAAFTLAAAAVALPSTAGCSASNGSSGTSATSSALSTSASIAASDGGLPANVGPCLTTYVECVRAGDTADACEKDLHACLRPPPPEGGPMGPGCGGGGGPGGDGPHGPPPNVDGGPLPPPPPDLDDDGGLPPPPPLLPDGGVAPGPFACFSDLRTCAQGSDAVDTCVSNAETCLASFPPPPPRPDGHGPGGGPGVGGH